MAVFSLIASSKTMDLFGLIARSQRPTAGARLKGRERLGSAHKLGDQSMYIPILESGDSRIEPDH